VQLAITIALSSHADRRLADPALAGDNEPYDLDPAVDYGIPFHRFSLLRFSGSWNWSGAVRRSLPH
jgi:hypothetical protein